MKKMLLSLYAGLMLSGMLFGQPLPEQRLREFADKQAPAAVSIAVIKEGNVTFYHFGREGPGHPQLPSERTLYEIGALSSVFTTTLMLRLQEEGTLLPGSAVADYLPDSIAPPTFQPQRCAEVVLPGRPPRRVMSCSPDRSRDPVCITFCDLAGHVSGLANSGLGLYDWHPVGKSARLTGPAAAKSEEAFLQYFDDAKVFKSEPGVDFYYSNPGIALLGHALSHVAQTPYEAALNEYVLRPIGLLDTKIAISAEQRTRYAQGHNQQGRIAANWQFGGMAPAAGLKSTAADMAAFLRLYLGEGPANWENTILEGQQARAEVEFPTLQWETQAAYGWLVSYLPADRPRLAVWLNGGTEGFRAFAGFVRDEKLGVVVLSASAEAEVTELGMELLRSW